MTPEAMQRFNRFGASFARWRWYTLFEATGGVLDLEFLRPRWPELKVMFKNAQDQGTLPNVEAAFEQDLFWDRCRAMRKLSGEANKHRRWGAGCSCHEQELLQGKSVDCNEKGRRVREVAKYIDRAVQSLRAAAESLSLALFGGCEDLVLDLYNDLVFMAALASAKLGFQSLALYHCQRNYTGGSHSGTQAFR